MQGTENHIDYYLAAFNSTQQFFAILDMGLTIIDINKAMSDFLGVEAHELVDVPYWELPFWEHSVELQNRIIFSIESIFLGEDVSFETFFYDKDGQIRDLEFTLKAICDECGEVSLVIAMGYDTTNIKKTAADLKLKERELSLFFEFSKDGYMIYHLDEVLTISRDADLESLVDFTAKHLKIFMYNKSFTDMLEIDAAEMTPFVFTREFGLSDEQKNGVIRSMLNGEVLEGKHEW